MRNLILGVLDVSIVSLVFAFFLPQSEAKAVFGWGWTCPATVNCPVSCPASGHGVSGFTCIVTPGQKHAKCNYTGGWCHACKPHILTGCDGVDATGGLVCTCSASLCAI